MRHLLFFSFVGFAALLMAIAYAITRQNREHFDRRRPAEYPQAIASLAKVKPRAAFAIRACYALLLLEWVVLFFFTR